MKVLNPGESVRSKIAEMPPRKPAPPDSEIHGGLVPSTALPVSYPPPYNESANRRRVAELQSRGVDVWGPERVYIAPDVNFDKIEPGSSIQQAALAGPELRIGRGARIGFSGHALVEDCQIGRNVELGAGTYRGATILDHACIRGFAELRPGTLIEEQVEAAHNVAFKNTVLTATVVTGSLINFCDIFMSGGTSRENHSEVGSGVVHFNFDPRGDKWSSLIGGVRGVLLRARPIFVGGQCGLVGPLHLDFGAVLAAGSVARRDIAGDRVQSEAAEERVSEGFDPQIYTGLRRKFLTTARLIGNLWALDAWYRAVRLPSAAAREKPLYESARGQLRLHAAERVKRLEKIIDKLERSIEKSSVSGDPALIACQAEHRLLIQRRREFRDVLTQSSYDSLAPEDFLKQYEAARAAGSHLEAVCAVDESAVEPTGRWLNELAGKYVSRAEKLFRANP